MPEATERKAVVRHAVTGAILGALCAVSAHVLGVQQLLRANLALYIPAALVGAILGVTRLRPLLWMGAGIIALLCIAIAYTPLVRTLARPLIRRDPVPAHVDLIAILSRGFTPDGMMRSETLDRVLNGLTLAKRGLAPVVLLSRERRIYGGRPASDSADLQAASAMAGLSTRVIFVDSVETTRSEALKMRAIARANGWNTVAVVTSPMHTKRACATFETVGFKVTCVPAAVREYGLYAGSNAEDRLRAFRSWLYETFAADTYRRRGWIP
jgi:uncharacterized SAM-binding protein YcdF (DUF218 family)